MSSAGAFGDSEESEVGDSARSLCRWAASATALRNSGPSRSLSGLGLPGEPRGPVGGRGPPGMRCGGAKRPPKGSLPAGRTGGTPEAEGKR